MNTNKSKVLWGKLKNLIIDKKNYEYETSKEVNLIKKEVNNDYYIFNITDNLKIYLIKEPNKVDYKYLLNNVKENGIDNTGLNFWPSEEVLTYYILNNINFNQESYNIIELGAGYNALCSIFLYKYLNKTKFNLDITDGNDRCLEYINKNLILNNINNIKSRKLIWGDNSNFWKNNYNLILLSDCLFFKEYHSKLINTLKYLLSSDGKILLMQPERNNSMKEFIELFEKEDRYTLEKIEYKNYYLLEIKLK